jgi:hypothetical protein
MQIKVDWFGETGKWAFTTRVEVDALAYEDNKILLEIIKNQRELAEGWEKSRFYFVVVSDIPESENDPNYRTTYSRLYSPKRIEEVAYNDKG